MTATEIKQGDRVTFLHEPTGEVREGVATGVTYPEHRAVCLWWPSGYNGLTVVHQDNILSAAR